MDNIAKSTTFSFGIDLRIDEEKNIHEEKNEIDMFINNQKAAATKSKNKTDLNTFNNFRRENGFSTAPIEDLTKQQLNDILCQFFMKALSRKGTLYEPDTLTGIRNSLQRVLNEKGCDFDLRSGQAFSKCREVLAARRKQLTKNGLGNRKNAARALDEDEVERLFTSNYFGSQSPVALQRTVWWFITQHFGHRARDEGRQLQFGDINVENVNGSEYLVWLTERSTKTRNGERPLGHKRPFNPKAFATGDNRCPVFFFKEFVSHRPKNMCREDSPLFLQVRYQIDPIVVKEWYLSKPLGKNSIGEFLGKARSILNNNRSTGKISNHSARKTTITNLMNNNINPLHIQQISGHKRLESLNNYNTASMQIQKKMSLAINNRPTNPQTSSLSSRPIPNDFVQQQPLINNNSFQQQFHPINNSLQQDFNPIAPIFSGAYISNCTFNINLDLPNTSTNNEKPASAPASKRRRVIFDDDDDE